MAQVSNEELGTLLESLIGLNNQLIGINTAVFSGIGGSGSNPVSLSSITVTSTSPNEQAVVNEMVSISENLAWLATVVNSLQSTATVSFATVTTETVDIDPPPDSGEKTN